MTSQNLQRGKWSLSGFYLMCGRNCKLVEWKMIDACIVMYCYRCLALFSLRHQLEINCSELN